MSDVGARIGGRSDVPGGGAGRTVLGSTLLKGVPTVAVCDSGVWFPPEAPPLPGRPLLPAVPELMCSLMSLSRPLPEHQHDFPLIAVVLAGDGLHEDPAGCLPILAGDICLIPAGQPHGYPRVRSTLSVFNLGITRASLAACVPLLGEISSLGGLLHDPSAPTTTPSTPLRLSPLALRRLLPLLLALTDEIQDPRASIETGVGTGLLLQILGWLNRTQRDRLAPSPEDERAANSSVHAAIHYLTARYMGAVSIEEVAAQVGYTSSYLAHKFQRHLNISPSGYLLNLRIQHACILLRDTNLPIADIASHVGFQDSRYFSTRFHHVTGMTPSVFRARWHLEPESPPL